MTFFNCFLNKLIKMWENRGEVAFYDSFMRFENVFYINSIV